MNHLRILPGHETFLNTIWTGWPVQLQRERQTDGERERERDGYREREREREQGFLTFGMCFTGR